MLEIKHHIPDIDSYLRLRKNTGLSPRSRKAVELGLPNSLFAVTVYDGEKVVGMGRVIGDGGCNYEVVDVAVEPEYQGKGLMQKGSHAGDYRSETVLNMPQLSREDLLGLQRTFPLYVRFPKSEWPRIKKCEGNGQEAEALYNELSREYTEKYL